MEGAVIAGDLRTCLARLGQPAPLPADQVSEMFEGHDNLNFTDFLAMFACRTVKDSENVLRKAFRCLDDTGGGKIDANATKELLTSGADRYCTTCVEAEPRFQALLLEPAPEKQEPGNDV